jgi:SAM-dependent methyltransferase
MALNTVGSVHAFHAAGAKGGPMLALYEASARSISRLLPTNGLLLDLGCGSGRCAAYFALRRPDATVVGIDVAEAMLREGHSLVRQEGLDDRVELRSGDMCDLGSLGSIRPAVVSATLSLHHLPGPTHLRRCLRGIAEIVERTGCGVWLFDLARLRDAESYRELLKATPAFSGVLFDDALASEAAAWTLDELRDMLVSTNVAVAGGTTAPLALFQAHWRHGDMQIGSGHGGHWSPSELPAAAEAEASGIDRQLGVKDVNST